MREIAIVASGTRGDVQPYIALGRGLQTAGYAVRLLSSDNFAPLVRDAGLTFCSTGQSVEDLLQSAEWREVLDGGNFLKILAQMRSQMGQVAVETAQQLPPLLRGSDLIIAGMSGLAGVFSVAEGLGIPVMQAHVFPFTPTREFPSPLVPKLPFGRALNRLSFQAMRQLFWQNFKAGDSAARQQLGLKRGSFWGPFHSLARSRVPVLYGYSPHVLPRPSDWADYQEVTGYWFLDAASDWTPPADLVEFLDAGPPPVYIGFGSMGSRDPEAAGRLAVEALARSGQRGVLAAGWGGLQVAELPATVHLVSSVPHSWLFPRMAAVVHHGGAGTTAAGLRAGVPSVLAPFMGDQAFWGHRVAALGVGPSPIPRKRLTAERLGTAISEATSNTIMQQRASDLGQIVRAEDGVGNAVASIDRFIQRLAITNGRQTAASVEDFPNRNALAP